MKIEFKLSREFMPDFDGEYYVCGYMHHECGNVTEFHRIAYCKNNQWIKNDIGEQITFWTNLLPFPKQDNLESDAYIINPGKYSRDEVIQIIDNVLEHADLVMDAITNEETFIDGEELLKLLEI